MNALRITIFLLLIGSAACVSEAQVYIGNVDGSAVKELGNVRYYVAALSLDRQGGELLLTVTKNNKSRVFSLTVDGHTLKQLSPDSAAEAYSPISTPDQSKILFSEYNSRTQIFSTDWLWSTPKLLIDNGAPEAIDAGGTRLVFGRFFGSPNYSEVLVVSALDGTGEHQITPVAKFSLNASFDQSGSGKIVYSEAGTGVVSVNPNGTDRQVLLKDENAFEPSFSPDGSHIVYASSPSGSTKYDIYVMNSDGSNPHRLTSQANMWCRYPIISNDGKKIFFVGIPIAKTVQFEKQWRSANNLPEVKQ